MFRFEYKYSKSSIAFQIPNPHVLIYNNHATVDSKDPMLTVLEMLTDILQLINKVFNRILRAKNCRSFFLVL